MDPVIYNNDFLHGHSQWEVCGCKLNDDISERDYPGKNYFDRRIDALDMDSCEKKLCKSQPQSTADAVIGIMTCENKTTSNPRLLLVELRMKYKNAANLTKQKLEDKIVHTKQLLGSEAPINTKSLFVFTDSVAPQAFHVVESLKREGGEIRNVEVVSASLFSETVKSYEDMPYNAIYKPKVVSAELWGMINKGEWMNAFRKISFWYNKALGIQNRYPFEYNNLRKIILSEWRKIREIYPCLPDDDLELEAQIIEEDVIRNFR